jgi:hypothetical protein
MPISLAATSGSSMHGAIVPIAYATPTNTASFTSIPQVYQDLFIVVYSRDTTSATTAVISVRFNNDTTTNYSATYLDGNGASATSSRASTQSTMAYALSAGATSTSGIFASNQFHILNYSNSTTYKTMLTRTAVDLNGSGNTRLNAGLWRSTAAINRVDVYPGTTFSTGTTIELFGVRSVGQ